MMILGGGGDVDLHIHVAVLIAVGLVEQTCYLFQCGFIWICAIDVVRVEVHHHYTTVVSLWKSSKYLSHYVGLCNRERERERDPTCTSYLPTFLVQHRVHFLGVDTKHRQRSG